MTLDQQFDKRTLHIVRETVLTRAVAAGMGDDRATDVMIAVHELAANAVCHGGGTGRIRMQVNHGELIIRVSDPGPASLDGHALAGITGKRHHGGTPAPAQPWPFQPGHGLWLARQVADHISVDSGPAGSRVTVAFTVVPTDIPGGPASPGAAR